MLVYVFPIFKPKFYIEGSYHISILTGNNIERQINLLKEDPKDILYIYIISCIYSFSDLYGSKGVFEIIIILEGYSNINIPYSTYIHIIVSEHYPNNIDKAFNKIESKITKALEKYDSAYVERCIVKIQNLVAYLD